jgi:hypothetical protein
VNSLVDIWESVQEAFFDLKREVLAFGGKKGVETSVHATYGATAAGGASYFSILGIGVASAVSVLVEEFGYMHRRDRMREFYREEIGAQVKKDPAQITTRDMDIVIKGDANSNINPHRVMDSYLAKQRTKRNVGVVVTATALLTTLTLLSFVGGFSAAPILAKMLIGGACFKMIEAPLDWVANKVFNLEKPTAHEHILNIAKDHRRGNGISKEQVLEVFVAANPEMDRFIESQYGQPYERLGAAAKVHAAEEMAKYIPLEKLVNDINHGHVKASELAFTVEGDMSGVLPTVTEQIKPSFLGKASEVLQGLVKKLGIGGVPEAEPAAASAPAAAPSAAAQPKPRQVVEYDNQPSNPDKSFLVDLTRERAQQSLGGHAVG